MFASFVSIFAGHIGEHYSNLSLLTPVSRFGLRIGDSVILTSSNETKICLNNPDQATVIASDYPERMALWSTYVRKMPIVFEIRTQAIKNQLEAKRFNLSQTRSSAPDYFTLALTVADLQRKLDVRKVAPSSRSFSIERAYFSLLDNESDSDLPSTKRSVELMRAVLKALQVSAPQHLPSGSKGTISGFKLIKGDEDIEAFQLVRIAFEFKKELKSVWIDESYLENDLPQINETGVVRDPVSYGGYNVSESEVFFNAMTAGDESTWKNQLKKARILKLKKGTKIKVVSQMLGFVQALIIDGTHKGKVLFIRYSQAVTEGKPPKESSTNFL